MTSVLIHKYHDRLTAIEHSKAASSPKNFLVFIGGLTDGFQTVPYVNPLAKALNEKYLSEWAVVEALISSSYDGFGVGSLKRDVRELGQLVKFLRTERGTKDSKVVLMGHSTGCQDTMEYLSKYNYEDDFDEIHTINGGILQAPASDTEAFEQEDTDGQVKKLSQQAEALIKEGKGKELMPYNAVQPLFDLPINAYRYHSLTARRTDDDYFSSYLTDDDYKNTFGKVSKPLLLFVGENDEYVPLHIDKQKLVDSWKKNTDPRFWSHFNGILKNANHKVDDAGAQKTLTETVVKFIGENY